MAIVSLVTVGISILLFLLSGHGEEQNLVLAAFASALLAIGVVSLVSEFVLKRSFTHELLDLVQLQRHLHEVGIKRICRASGLDWREMFDGVGQVFAIPIEPTLWVSREWSHVMDAAGRAAVDVTVYLAHPEKEAAARLAAQLGIEVDAFRSELREAARRMEESWSDAREQVGRLDAGSTLTLAFVDASPAYSVLGMGSRVLMGLPPVMHGRSSRDAMACDCAAERGGIIANWAADQLNDAERKAGVPTFTDKKPHAERGQAIGRGAP